MTTIISISAVIITLFFEGANATSNKWMWSREAEVTRCFKSESVTVHCQDYSYKEKARRILVQELEIDAIDSYGIKRNYSYGKAIEGPFCQQHLIKIKKLLSRADQRVSQTYVDTRFDVNFIIPLRKITSDVNLTI